MNKKSLEILIGYVTITRLYHQKLCKEQYIFYTGCGNRNSVKMLKMFMINNPNVSMKFQQQQLNTVVRL